MRKPVLILIALGFVMALSACMSAPAGSPESPSDNDPMDMMPGMGLGGGMMGRHHAQVPEEYAGMTNPVPADADSLARGEEHYTSLCATCHGDGGMGDGSGGVALDPAPAPIAHTSQMLADDYLFWRISAGGVHFETAMPAWEVALDEGARWDLINYVRALGSGEVTPRGMMGGATLDPEVEAAKQAEMLAEAVAQGLITEEEAAVFAEAHPLVDAEMMLRRGAGVAGSMDDRMAAVLADLVENGALTQAQANTFASVHDRLAEAGLMR